MVPPAPDHRHENRNPEYPDMIEVEVWSRNQTSNPPIDLYLTSDDAKELAMRILRELS